MRNGVHGSALPGRRTSGIFSAIAGTHSRARRASCSAARRRARRCADRSSRRGRSCSPWPAIEQRQVEAARQPAQDACASRHHAGDALHVAAHHRVRHAGRRRQLLDVVVRRLLRRRRAAACRSENGPRRSRTCRSAASTGIAASARAPIACRSGRRSRRMRPTLAWLISTNGSRVAWCGARTTSRLLYGTPCRRIGRWSMFGALQLSIFLKRHFNDQRVTDDASRMTMPFGTSTGCAQVCDSAICSASPLRTCQVSAARREARPPWSAPRGSARRFAAPHSFRPGRPSSTSRRRSGCRGRTTVPFSCCRSRTRYVPSTTGELMYIGRSRVVPDLPRHPGRRRCARGDSRRSPCAFRKRSACPRRPTGVAMFSFHSSGKGIVQSALPDRDLDADDRLVGHRDQVSHSRL